MLFLFVYFYVCVYLCVRYILFCLFDRCPKEMSPHLPTIIKLCLKYITYDPNYNYDADDDQDDSMDIEDREDEDQGDLFDHHCAILGVTILFLSTHRYFWKE